MSASRALRKIQLPKERWVRALSAPDRAVLEPTVEKLRDLNRSRQQLAELYGDAVERSRSLLDELAAHPSLERGILFASEDLFRQLRRSRKEALRPARRRRLDLGLTRYLSRASAKATPFGAFCSVAWLELEESADPPSELRVTGSTECHVRVNKALLWPIMQALGGTREDEDCPFPVRLATCLRRPDGRISYWVRDGYRELLCSLPANPTLAALESALAGGSLEVDALLERLQVERGLGSGILRKALARGLLVVEVPFDDRSPNWVEQLGSYLAQRAESGGLTLEVAEGLLELAPLSQRMSRNTQQSGWQVWQSAVSCSRRICESVAPNRGLRYPPFYEDHIHTERAVLRDARLGDTRRELEIFLRHVVHRDGRGKTRRALARFLRESDAPATLRVVDLYELFYDTFRRLREEEAERRQADESANAIGQPAAAERSRDALLDLLGVESGLASRAEVRVAPEALRDRLPDDGEHLTTVATAFLTPFQEDRGVSYVVGSLGAGFGRFLSRYLYMLDPSLAERIRERNASAFAETAAELVIESNFNPDLAPVMTPVTILHPTLSRSVGALSVATIDVEDLSVRIVGDDLELFETRANRKIIPLYCNMLNELFLPKLATLLMLFSPPSARPLPRIDLAGLDLVTPAFLDFPRVRLGERLILRRRTWVATGAEVPAWEPSPAAFFSAIRRWRRSRRLPEVCYVRKQDPNARYNDDRRKPMFLDFASVQHVESLRNLLARDERSCLIFEEELPAPAALFEIEGSRRCVEAVVELSLAGAGRQRTASPQTADSSSAR